MNGRSGAVSLPRVSAPEPLDRFSEPVRAWFSTTFAEATPPQAQGWPAIASGDHTLVLAPTGSGKTLAAFLWGLDRLVSEPPPDDKEHRTRLIYVSPLRALAEKVGEIVWLTSSVTRLVWSVPRVVSAL